MIIIREETDYTEAIEAYKNDPLVILEPWGRSIDHLRLTIIGKKGTPYADGKFVFEIKFPENYPFAPPYAYAVTLMWHPNIDSSIPPGKLNICLDLINPDLVGKVDASTGASGWTPSKTLTNIIEALKGMMHVEPPFFNPGDPLNHEAGEQYFRAQKKFEAKANTWTKKYAMD
ncbi:MAG: ubiquitin-conjugating enzyme family protein [Promethearchaeota archaeon]